ncbi:unnamed protein product [Lupinus luteus]|uniref:Uncharacterized protein n=1 Tax=Lupinus luteus TaxID=3873 RepID=A0AAV1W0P0_LUPLU
MSSPPLGDSLNKTNKTFLFFTIKPNDLVSLILKAGLTISTFFLVTLFFYPTLSNQYHNPTNSITTFHQNIFQRHTTTINIDHEGDEPTNISHILFGIGGSTATWDTRRYYTELWWQPDATRGFVWLEKEPDENQTWPGTSPPYMVSSDTSSFKYTCWYGSRAAIRIARIVKESFELGLSNVRWFVMGDDDTVFFPDNLVTVLSKYDHNQMYYVGGNSESVEQDLIHFYTMAYGGGGFAISYPLAKELVNILDGCIDRYAQFYGSDQKIQSCISEIGVQLTKELGFHQVDIRGNPYGLLASHPVAPLVSLHHLDYVDPIFPNMTRVNSVDKLVTAYKSDPGRILQHSFCYDLSRNWSISISWGYSLELYPYLATTKELETSFRTFKTWRSWQDEPFTFNTRPVSDDPCENPLVYFLDRVGNVGGSKTRSRYKRHVDYFGKECEKNKPALAVQYVDVSASHFMPHFWRKAPRRQCCDIIKDANVMNSIVMVKIRECNSFESVTPP